MKMFLLTADMSLFHLNPSLKYTKNSNRGRGRGKRVRQEYKRGNGLYRQKEEEKKEY